MKLMGRDVPADLWSRIEERLAMRGLAVSRGQPTTSPEGVVPRVEPLSFNVGALEEHADATRALPLHTHRGGAGRVVLLAKWAFRKTCQVFINETLARQRVFNGHVRDSYAQLAAEVMQLRREVASVRAAPSPGRTSAGDSASAKAPRKRATTTKKKPPKAK